MTRVYPLLDFRHASYMRSSKAALVRSARSALAQTSRRAQRINIPNASTPVAARRPRKQVRVADGRPLSSTAPVTGSEDAEVPTTPAADPIPEPEPAAVPTPSEIPPEPPAEDAEKPKRKTRTAKESGASAPPTLPSELDVLWQPSRDGSIGDNGALPPTEIFSDALTSLLVALHPQTQNRATYASAAGAPVEPALALYCPIEGGDYVVDETVRELARRTGADVLVIDAVQLAAGEWGSFGKGK
jgi:hypothetical protein